MNAIYVITEINLNIIAKVHILFVMNAALLALFAYLVIIVKHNV